MALGRMLKSMRLSMAQLPIVGYGRLPLTPVYVLRDLWPGDSIKGMTLTKGHIIVQNETIFLKPGVWGSNSKNKEILKSIYNFSWLRDLRDLGTDNARLCARALISDWISNPPDTQNKWAFNPLDLGNRLTHWLGNYDFFAASADDRFRSQFMQRVMVEGKYAIAMLPLAIKGYSTFALFKGIMAVILCLPEQFNVLPKLTKYLKAELKSQFLKDGVHIERNPETQLMVLRDLVELKMMYQIVNLKPPEELANTMDLASRALRGLRHGDGKLALFNGATESSFEYIERVISLATSKKITTNDMSIGGYIRCLSDKATLLVDVGKPVLLTEKNKHAGCLSMEFSYGKQRIFVNCGTSSLKKWRNLLGLTAAHSVLSIEHTNSIDFSDTGNFNNFEVVSKYIYKKNTHCIQMGHNGWLSQYGAIYQRILCLSNDGKDLRGEERIEADKTLNFTIRFHLHSSFNVEEDIIQSKDGQLSKIIVLMTGGDNRQVWWFRSKGAEACIEESVYFGDGSYMPTKQIVLTFHSSVLEKKDQNVTSYHEDIDLMKQNPSSIQSKENEDYVAIFHNQGDEQKVGEETFPRNHNGTNYQTSTNKKEKSLNVDSHDSTFVHVVKWALQKKN